MDNFFEILIYVLIIISFLSSFFRKKGKPKQNSSEIERLPQSENLQQDVSYQQPEPADDYDFLKEVEKYFKVGDEESVQGKRTTRIESIREEIRTKSKEKISEEGWHEQTPSEHSYTTDNKWKEKEKELRQITKLVDENVERQAANLEKVLDEKSSTSEPGMKIKSKLNNRTNIKDYIVFSEILGKPKALRRWTRKNTI